MLAADHAAYLTLLRKVRKAAGSLPVGSNDLPRLKNGIPKSALLTRMTSSVFEAVIGRSDEAAVQLQLGQLDLDLERWRAEHGRYPETLAALGLPAEDTSDPFNDQPFVYRVEDDAVLLYSVGRNGKDDGGTTGKRGDLVWQVRRQADKPVKP